MTPGIFNRIDLSGVSFARLDEYFGLWSMEPSRFHMAWERASQMDLAAHVEQTAPAKAQVHTAVVPASDQASSFGPSRQILIAKAAGVLMKQVPSGEHGSSTILLRRVIREAINDQSIAGVIMVIDSPGGTVSGTSDLAADIAMANQVKPVWAFIEDLGASAAYWCACACERIIANHRTAFVGSIGTAMGLYDTSEKAAKEGVEAAIFDTGYLKSAGFPGAPLTDKQRAYFRGLIHDTQASFAQAVMDGRGLSAQTVAELSTGGVWLADEAMELGLIDAIQSLDETIDEMRQHLADHESQPQAGPSAGSMQQERLAMSKTSTTAHKPKQPAALARSKAQEDDQERKPTVAQDDEEKPKAQDDDEDDKPHAQDAPKDDECDCAGEEGCDCDDPDEQDAPTAEGDEEDEDDPPAAKPKANARAAEGQAFIDAFGKRGAMWYAQGKTFEEARALHVQALQKENDQLKARLAGVDRGATAPLRISGDAEKSSVDPRLAANVGRGVASFASGIKIPKSE